MSSLYHIFPPYSYFQPTFTHHDYSLVYGTSYDMDYNDIQLFTVC